MTETIYSTTTKVKCQGKNFPEDHPIIYLEIDPEIGEIICPYCGKKFQLTK